jgi:hypothetical protein
MIFTDVKNASWANAEHTVIDCFVKFENFPDYVPFTASPSDTEPHAALILKGLHSGKYGYISPFVEKQKP